MLGRISQQVRLSALTFHRARPLASSSTNAAPAMTDWKSPDVITALYSETYSDDPLELKAGGNAPVAGARVEKVLPSGDERFQLYSLGTPNGQKVSIMLEELADAADFKYDAFNINIMTGDQFGSGFTDININGKIPSLLDRSPKNMDGPLKLMESGAILMHLAEESGLFLPKDPKERMAAIQWLMWQMGSLGPMFGQMNHFYRFMDRTKHDAIEYGTARYGMETQRLLSVMEIQLGKTEYMGTNEITIADFSIFPWVKSTLKAAGAFLQEEKYPRVLAYIEKIDKRPAVQRGLQVNSFGGVAKPWLEKK